MAEQLSAQDSKKRLENGTAILLDVRHKEEVEFTSIKPHIWIELTELPKRFSELPKNKQIICICRTGSRSNTAADFLERNGYKASNVRGGIFEWSKIDGALKKYVYGYEGEKLRVEEI
ncbi:MAG TPA: rhodanese-like domain-containing protein [archaeon]|nr:rhodanese-like domain-containing protein [archaeon]